MSKKLDKILANPKIMEARQKINIIYRLADVINTYLVDVEPILRCCGAGLKYEEKRNMKKLHADALALKHSSKILSNPIYNLEECDTLSELVLLIDKVTEQGDDSVDKLNDIIKLIKNTYKV